jgi:methylmalonyl-CoA epimerase
MSDFRVLGVNHIGLAPKDIEKARWFFETVLNLPFLGTEVVQDQGTSTEMFSATSVMIESDPGFTSRLELLSPTTEEGPIAKFLAKKGGGIHHIALCVDDIVSAIRHLKSHQIQMVDETPRQGAHQTKIAFVHPVSTGGLLVELVEEPS